MEGSRVERTGGRMIWMRTARGDQVTTAAPAACPPTETTSLWEGARTERLGKRRAAGVGDG